MSTKRRKAFLDATILASVTMISLLCAQEASCGQSPSFLRAEEVSRQWLTRHPRPRDDAEKRIIAVTDDMRDNQACGMGNVLPQDGRLMRMLTESFEAQSVVEIATVNDVRVRAK